MNESSAVLEICEDCIWHCTIYKNNLRFKRIEHGIEARPEFTLICG